MKLERTAALWLLLFGGYASVAAAQNPFIGAWKLDQANSHLAGAKIDFAQAEGEAIQLSANGAQYSFRVDGKDYRMASGDLAAWRQIDENTWRTTYLKTSGKLLDVGTWKLSSDGRVLTEMTTGSKPDGQSFTNIFVYSRTSGAGGLLGAWRCTSVQLSSPDEIILANYGLGGLSVRIPSLKVSMLAAFDGRDVAPSGPDVPPGLTIALVRIGPAGFRVIERLSGAVVYSARCEVSDDEKTMTVTGNSPGDPAQIAVWLKQ